jgi:hypothetical protein
MMMPRTPGQQTGRGRQRNPRKSEKIASHIIALSRNIQNLKR